MPAKIEVEQRGLLSQKRFLKLKGFFSKNAKFLGEKDRLSLIYFRHKSHRLEDERDNTIDLKLRITNKKPELVLKHGKWGSKDSRKEFGFQIERRQFWEMAEFLKVLGFTHGVLNATKTFAFKYKGMEFALVEVPGWGHYFEAEILSSKKNWKKADERLDGEIQKLGLKIVGEKEYLKLLKSLNSRKGFHFDFEKEGFSRIRKKFRKYL